MINIIRSVAVAVAVVVLSLAAPALADSIHPDLKRSQVITLDVAAIERNAQSGNPFELALGDKRLNVVLTPASVWPKEGLTILEIQKDGSTTKRVVQGNITYAGEIVGEDPKVGEARFTIAGGVLLGSVRTSAGWWFIEPLARFAPKADTSQYVVYETRDVNLKMAFGSDGVRSNVLSDPTPPFTCPPQDNRISVAMVADREYFNQHLNGPLTYWQQQTALVNEISGIYEQDQFKKKFRLGLSMVDSNGVFLQSTDPEMLLAELDLLVDPWLNQLQDLCSHLVHLTSGKELDGPVLGIANQPGWTGLTQQVLGNNEFLYYQNYIVAAHEIAHNFDAIHAEAEEWCEPIPEDPFHCRWRRTLDFESFDAVTIVSEFSDGLSSNGTIQECKNNVQRMRAKMAQRHLWP